MFDHLHDDPRAKGQPSDVDRNVKIERLLLAGLGHYFQGRYERAIDVWSRVLFLDRKHARARAYIDRARSGLAERLRESEELVHTGVEAFERGDVSEARSLLTSAVERGGGRDEALTVLERLNRLEAAAGDGAPSPVKPRLRPSRTQRSGVVGIARPSRRVRVVPLVLFAVLVSFAGYLAMSWGEWESVLFGPPSIRAATAVSEVDDALPILSGASVKLGRARRLIEEGRLHSALAVLGTVTQGDPEGTEADLLRARVQRRLLAGLGPSGSGSPNGELARPGR